MHDLTNLPEDVLASILVRLPARSIASFRSVCRAWRSAVSHPFFDSVHALRPASVAKVTVATVLAATETTVAFDFFRGRWHRDRDKALPSPCTLRFTSCTYPSKIAVVGSWDGIVCIQRRIWKPAPPGPGCHIVDQYTLWNPLTMACADASAPTNGCGEIIGAYAHVDGRRFHLLHASSETVGSDRPIAPTAFRILGVGDATIWREVSLDLEEEILMDTHFVRLHGNLHWLVLSGSGSTLRLLAFHTTQEKFRTIEAPERQRQGRADLTTARLGALSGGKLCIFDLEPSTSSMNVWVLDDYDALPQSSWRLMERISLVMWDKSDLSRTYSMSKVEVVQSVHDGEEIFLHKEDGRIYAYNLAGKVWRTVNVSQSSYWTSVSLVMHRKSVLPAEVSFGEASSPALPPLDVLAARLQSLAVY